MANVGSWVGGIGLGELSHAFHLLLCIQAAVLAALVVSKVYRMLFENHSYLSLLVALPFFQDRGGH